MTLRGQNNLKLPSVHQHYVVKKVFFWGFFCYVFVLFLTHLNLALMFEMR